MRRNDKEITDRTVIESIIEQSVVCRLAMSEGDRPYVVPLNFGYKDNTLYFHAAGKGKKLDILRKNNRVCFEFDIDHELVKGDNACNWGMKYRSVIGFGRASFVERPEQKRQALQIIVKHYGADSFADRENAVKSITILKVDIENITGKKSGY